MDIGDRIRARREELGMSQEELAHAIGYKSRSSINKIELDGQGLPQKKVVQIARALRVTPGFLMGWEDELYVDENGEAVTVAELSPIEDELMNKIKMMRPDFQRMASSMLDSILEMQQNAERIGSVKEETNDD